MDISNLNRKRSTKLTDGLRDDAFAEGPAEAVAGTAYVVEALAAFLGPLRTMTVTDPETGATRPMTEDESTALYDAGAQLRTAAETLRRAHALLTGAPVARPIQRGGPVNIVAGNATVGAQIAGTVHGGMHQNIRY